MLPTIIEAVITEIPTIVDSIIRMSINSDLNSDHVFLNTFPNQVMYLLRIPTKKYIG